jgi:hypothetical protein
VREADYARIVTARDPSEVDAGREAVQVELDDGLTELVRALRIL